MTSVKCPTCGTGVAWTESSRYRPFCSRRCQTTDLGDWAAERFRIAGTSPSDDLERDPDNSPAPVDPKKTS